MAFNVNQDFNFYFFVAFIQSIWHKPLLCCVCMGVWQCFKCRWTMHCSKRDSECCKLLFFVLCIHWHSSYSFDLLRSLNWSTLHSSTQYSLILLFSLFTLHLLAVGSFSRFNNINTGSTGFELCTNFHINHPKLAVAREKKLFRAFPRRGNKKAFETFRGRSLSCNLTKLDVNAVVVVYFRWHFYYVCLYLTECIYSAVCCCCWFSIGATFRFVAIIFFCVCSVLSSSLPSQVRFSIN